MLSCNLLKESKQKRLVNNKAVDNSFYCTNYTHKNWLGQKKLIVQKKLIDKKIDR